MIGSTQAKAEFSKLLDSPTPVIISKGGTPVSAIIPYEEYLKMKSSIQEHKMEKLKKRANDFLSGNEEEFEEIEIGE